MAERALARDLGRTSKTPAARAPSTSSVAPRTEALEPPNLGELSRSQAERRRRILDEAAGLAAAAGVDAVQMRDVAAAANVALGTLYRYFPSKEHLLASLLDRNIEALADVMRTRPAKGDTPIARVLDLLGRANRAFTSDPEASAGQIRALVTGDGSARPVVVALTEKMRALVAEALGDSAALDLAEITDLADTIFDVWMAALVGWIAGLTGPDEVMVKLERSLRLMFGAAGIDPQTG